MEERAIILLRAPTLDKSKGARRTILQRFIVRKLTADATKPPQAFTERSETGTEVVKTAHFPCSHSAKLRRDQCAAPGRVCRQQMVRCAIASILCCPSCRKNTQMSQIHLKNADKAILAHNAHNLVRGKLPWGAACHHPSGADTGQLKGSTPYHPTAFYRAKAHC